MSLPNQIHSKNFDFLKILHFAFPPCLTLTSPSMSKTIIKKEMEKEQYNLTAWGKHFIYSHQANFVDTLKTITNCKIQKPNEASHFKTQIKDLAQKENTNKRLKLTKDELGCLTTSDKFYVFSQTKTHPLIIVN